MKSFKETPSNCPGEMTLKATNPRFYMPICLDVSEAGVVMIGGGNVALKKLRSIVQYAGNVYVFAKNILPEIKSPNLFWLETSIRRRRLP